MIEYNSKVWFRHLINFRRSDTFRRLLVEMLMVALYTAGVAYLVLQYLDHGRPEDEVNKTLKNTTIMHSILGFVLSMLLVFRTNSAYDRWWEGRKLWGKLVNVSRNLAIKINAYLPQSNQAARLFFRTMIPNYVYCLKEHLRNNKLAEEIDEIEGIKESLQGKDHWPNLLIQEMYRKSKSLVESGEISGDEQIVIDRELSAFADIQGGCERIKNTPIPFSYNIFLKKFIFFYVITIPLGFVAYFQYWAIPISVFVFYVLVSLEIIAEEIEDPFGIDANDLPTGKLSVKIKQNVQEIFEN